MDKKRKANLVLTHHEKLLIRCFNKNIITMGGLTDNVAKIISKHRMDKLITLTK